MRSIRSFLAIFALLLVVLSPTIAPRVALAADALVLFRSEEGKFTISLPGQPKHNVTPLGDGKDPTRVQHQFVDGGPDGAYLVSYQDNPNLAGADAKRMNQALEVGRDQLKAVFGGEVTQDAPIQLAKKHPGREVVVTIPAAEGIARCRLYLVGTRLYQVMVVGKADFANTERSTKVMESFAIVNRP